MTKHTPTPEQDEAIEAFRSGDQLKTDALAGTGKTTTQSAMAASTIVNDRLQLLLKEAEPHEDAA